MSNGPESENKTPTASWWSLSLSRREAGKMGMSVAALASATGCSSEEEPALVEMDSLEAQKKAGWNVGEEQSKLTYAQGGLQVSNTTATNAPFAPYLAPKKLMEATRPKSAQWKAYEMPTLQQSLEQLSLAREIKPVKSSRTELAHGQAHGLASLVTAVEDPEATMLIVDMPGPQAVATAAGMADRVEPVFYMDNWPHPKGVVPSHQTLGSMVYYAPELEEKKARRPDKAPVAMVLDSNRLNAYRDGTQQFDNRYGVALPTAEDLKKQGIKRVMYVSDKAKDTELDDVNPYAVDYEGAGLNVQMVSLDAFQQDPEVAKEADRENDGTRGYYYGGHRHHHTHFYTHYPMFLWIPGPRYSRWPAPARSVAPTRVRAPAYKPKSRPTLFSSRTTGGAKGVGRTKPTGFGRVSTRVNKSGKVLGTKSSWARRSGSRGRFRSSSGWGG